MRKVMMVLGFGAALAAGSASAQGVYFGGGLSSNSLSGFDDEMGYQVFGGLELAKTGQIGLGVEAGYMNAGEFEECYTVPTFDWATLTMVDDKQCYGDDVAGVWAAGVADFAFTPQLSGIGRVGLDFGDDDGLLFGAGLGYDLSRQLEVRGEYVIRDNVDSLQLNLVYRP